MINLTLAEIAAAVDGFILNESGQDQINFQIENISTDSRQILPNTLFIALKGERFDGHDFVGKAINNNSAALLLERQLAFNVPQIIVKDCHKALGQLGALVRNKVNPFCLALTGSNGKTSVKEMVATIIEQKHKVLFTAGNFNNDIGVPLTLLRLSLTDEFGVFELGANHAGEIDYTSSLVRPCIALVNNVASAHLEGFGTLEGVAKAKLEIFNHLDANGTAIINADDEFAVLMIKSTAKYKQITFGINHDADIKGIQLQADAFGRYLFLIVFNNREYAVSLPLAGKHQVSNALAATAMCLAAGFSIEEIIEGLAKLKPVKGRMLPFDLGRLLLVDDTYNANPASVSAAIDWLADLDGQKVLVLGHLAELGENADLLHRQLGLTAKEKGIDALFCFGELSKGASESFGCEYHLDIDLLVASLVHYINRTTGPVTVLVKGSRSAAMERVVEALNAANGRGELV